MRRSFQMVDVFGDGPFSGNPLGVVADAGDLDFDTMQRIARWLNLSETTFLLPPTDPRADYRVRIFTLERELPFAGHPTLGTCHAWLSAGGRPRDPGRIVQQCGAGLVPLRHDGGRLAFAAPPLIRSGPVEAAELEEAAAVLNIARSDIVDAQWVDNGPGWLGILLASAEEVLAIEPQRHHKTRIDIGVVGPHAAGQDVAFELRAIFSDHTGALVEDPVTGSLNASVAQWLIGSGRAPASYLAAQGTRLGRRGRIHVEQADGEIWIGGSTVTEISGH
ncbi:MAG: PhzF family phenazine biosynthesis protein, partial [Sphingomonadales bacterium]